MESTQVNKVTHTSRQAVGIALVVIGLAMVAYALSDDPFYGGEPGFGTIQGGIAAVGAVVALCALFPLAMAQRVLLLVISSLMTLTVAELGASYLLSPRYRPIYQYDERLLFKFIPGRSSAMNLDAVNGGERVSHRINANGFRGPELRRDGKAARVVVYGDSYVHAYYTRDEQTFCAQLSTALQKDSGREVEVVNAGVSSYGPDQVALRMETELPQLRPDVVIVAIFAGNDYGDLLRNKIFRLGASGELEANAWTIDPKIKLAMDVSQKESVLKRAVRELASRWRHAPPPAGDPAAALDGLLEEAQREYRSAVLERDNVVTNTHIDYYSADVSLTPDSPSARYKVDLMKATMRRIRDVAARHKVPLAFMIIPHRFDVADHYDWGPVDMQRFPRYDVRNQTAPLQRAAAELQAPSLDLFDVFRAHGAAKMYLLGGDDHWNARGQAVAASAMAEFLKLRGWLGRAPAQQ